MTNNNSQKTFLVFNTSHFGDTLLCNSLCQNIKKLYPDSKIIFIVNKPFADAAKYQKDVDEVISFDKFGEHKSIINRLKFIINFPYKRADYSFVTYRNNTNSLFSRLIFSKHIIEYNKKHIYTPMQEYFVQLLKQITDKPISYVPMKYEVTKELPENLSKYFDADKKYVGLCTLTTNIQKDIPVETAYEIINRLSEKGYTCVFLGLGNQALQYSEDLKKRGCKFIDLINKTSIKELGSVLKNCEALISADTGVMHMGCAVDIPVVSVFYLKDYVTQWAPDGNLYKCTVISENQTAENICNSLETLLNSGLRSADEFASRS